MRKKFSVRKKTRPRKRMSIIVKRPYPSASTWRKWPKSILVHFEEGEKLSELLSFRLTFERLFNIGCNLISFLGSPVYTPKDDGLWMLAKLSVQGADLGYNQVAEHLAKTHLLLEPFCVSKDRQLSENHPLHQIIKYHCRLCIIFGFLILAICIKIGVI